MINLDDGARTAPMGECDSARTPARLAQYEAWVASQPGVKLDAASVGALNSAISGYHHGDDVRATICATAGIPDDAAAPKDAVNLNNLDDWAEFHAAELA